MAKLFVSYSRRDSLAARKLIESFRSIEHDVWVDWESIPPAVDWLEQIFRGIETADAFIFLISPDSIASEVCKVEINKAVQNNKRIIPIVLRDVHPKETPESISKLNWTFMRETDNFEEGLAKVKTAIELDLDWLEEHRRLQVRALEWHRRKDISLLLRGRDLRNARHMVETATSKDPTPTDLQKTYIQHSLRNERNRTAALVSGGIALVIMAILAIIAVNQSTEATRQKIEADRQRNYAEVQSTQAVKNEILARQNEATAQANEQEAKRQESIANENKTIAEAQRSAARAQIYLNRPGELYTSTLLAIDSMRRASTVPETDALEDPSAEAEEILRRNLSLLPLPVEQFTQSGKINALALSPQGDMFVTGSADGTVCGWSIEQEPISNLFCTPQEQPAVNAVAFHPQGTFLVTGNQAGLVQVLDPKTGEVLHAFDRVEPSGQVQIVEVKDGNLPDGYAPRGEPVRSISVRPTKTPLIGVAYDDGEIPVFDPFTGKINSRLSIVNRPNVTGLSPTGVWLVTGSETGQVSAWNFGNGNRFSTSTHRGGVLALDFGPRSIVATAGGNSIAVSNLSTEKELYRIPVQSPIRDIAFAPGGAWFVTGSDDHRIRVWAAETGDELLSMSQDGVITDVAIASNGQWIASTGEDRTARVWDAKTGAELFQIPLKASGARLAFGNEDKWLISTDSSGAIAIWDISQRPTPALSVPSDDILTHVQYSPSGEWVAVAAEDQVWLLTPDPDSILKAKTLGIPIHAFDADVKQLAFSPDSELLGILTEEDEVVIHNIDEHTAQAIASSGRIASIAFTPDSQQLMTSDSGGVLQVWNVLNGGLIANAEGLPQGSALASTEEVLAVGSQDSINLLRDGNGTSSPTDLSVDPALLVFSTDGSLLAASSSNGETTIFQYQDGTLTKLSAFRKEQATSLAFHPDGKLLAVATAQNVYLMDIATGREVARIPYMTTVNGVSFSTDGNYLAVASSRSLEFWKLSDIRQVRSDELIAAACSYLYENLSTAQWQQFFGNEPYQPLCENLKP